MLLTGPSHQKARPLMAPGEYQSVCVFVGNRRVIPLDPRAVSGDLQRVSCVLLTQ